MWRLVGWTLSSLSPKKTPYFARDLTWTQPDSDYPKGKYQTSQTPGRDLDLVNNDGARAA